MRTPWTLATGAWGAISLLAAACANSAPDETMAKAAFAAPPPPAIAKEPGHVYVCTFNVYKLGSVEAKYLAVSEAEDDPDGVPGGIPERIKNLARVVAVGAFDLVVFEEVTHGIRGKLAMADLVAELGTAHGLAYEFFLSDYIGDGLMPEAIAFLWNPAAVRPELVAGETSLVVNVPIPGRDLVRTQWEAGDFDFTLYACHLAWSNEGDRDAGFEKVREIFWTGAPSQHSPDPDVLVLGDFNRWGLDYRSHERLPPDPTKFLAPNVLFFDPGFNVVKQVTKASILGKGVPGDNPQFVSTTVAQNTFVYDMILISRDVAEEFTGGAGVGRFGVDWGIVHFDEPGGVGHQPGAEDLSHNDLKEAYSDHRPLWMRFKTNAGAADDGPGGVSPPPAPATAEYVATAHGTRFHRPTCSTIQGRETPRRWATREAAAAALPPCGVCKP